MTPAFLFRLRARAALAWTKKKRSLRNDKLKVNKASETEEQTPTTERNIDHDILSASLILLDITYTL